jgi:hypothetical protein
MNSEQHPEREYANPDAPETTDWDELMADYEWRFNIVNDPNDPLFESGLRLINTLRERYGYDNVITNLGAYDSDKNKLARIPGRLGVHVRKGATRIDERS